MSKVKQFLLKNWPMTLGTMIILSIVLYYVVFNGGVQVFHYDMMEQVIRFILRGYELIRTPELEWWDWTHFMGSSIFSYGFYFLFTPFWLFFAILSDKGDIPYIFMYVNMLKLVILFITTSFYLSKIRKNKISVYLGASMLTFSGFTMGYYNYTFFTDTLIFVPLALYFIEVFLEDRKFLGLTITISIMAMINVYLLVLFTPYLFLYTLFRYFNTRSKIELKATLLDAGKFIIIFILGIGVGFVLFLPNIDLMLSSSRILGITDILKTISIRDLFRYITSFLQPVVDRNDFNPLISKYVVPSFGHSGGSAVYSFIITPLLISQILFIKDDLKHKIGILALYSFLIIIMFFPNLYFLLQGNSDTRWMVMFIFLNVYTITYLIDNLHLIDKRVLIISFGLLVGLIVSTYYFSRWNNLHIDEIYYSISKRNIVISLILLCSYLIVFLFLKKKLLLTVILALLITGESYLSLYNIFFNPVSSISMRGDEIPSYQLTNDGVFREIEALDSSEYRIDVIENYGFNNPMSKGYMGFTFYSSVYNFQVDDFIQDNIASAGGWVVSNNAGKWQFKQMFGSKYWMDFTSESTVPFGYSFLDTLKYDNQFIKLFRNDYPVPIMYAMSDTLNYDAWKSLSSLDKMRSIMSQVVTYDSQNINVKYPYPISSQGTFGDRFSKTFESPMKDVIVEVSLPRSEEVRMTFKYSGDVVHSFYSYEPQYSSTYVQKEFDEMIVEVSNLYGVPEEEFLNEVFIEYPKVEFVNWYEGFERQFVDDINLGNNEFSAEYDSEFEQWIVTSIAYDKNWNVEVNGEDVVVEKVNGGFIGFRIPKGHVMIKGSYFPKEIIIGSGVTLLSIGIIILIKNKHWI